MKKLDSKNITKLFTVFGTSATIVLWIVLLIIDLSSKDLRFSAENIAEIHKNSPGWWIIDMLPIIGVFISYFVGKAFANAMEATKQIADMEFEKSKKIFEFTEKLSNGDIDAEIEISKEDDLGKSILNLRNYLRNSKLEEIKRRKEDEQRNWATEGLAKFGEILRGNNDNVEALSYEIISHLIKYLKANQGGFFLLNDDNKQDKYFELTACYAYERKKFTHKRIEWGEGLVGTCAIERESIFMTDVPDDYISITSGLGDSNPRCLFIVPLKINDEIHGVLEIASFRAFEKFEIDFVEKLAESIASTISSVKINLRTSKLLKQSQEQAEILKEQEEEMRQNIEELHATQEEAARQGAQLASFTESVNHTMVRAEYDTSGKLLYANTRFLSKLGYSSNQEIEGKHISIFINEKDREWFLKIWESLSKGGKHFEGDMKHVTKQGTDFWSMATYTCVRDQFGTVQKILFLGIDTTEQKKQSLDFESQLKALSNSIIKVDFEPNARVLDCNKKFISAVGYSYDDLKKMTVFEFLNPENTHEFKTNWNEIIKGAPLEGQFNFVPKHGEAKWLQGTFTAVYDMYNEVSKIILIANDITSQKLLEIEAQRKTEQLIKQEEQLKNSQLELQSKFGEIQAVKIRNEETLEGAMDAIITINQNEIIEVFNRAAENLLGFTKNEVIGKSIHTILPPQFKDLKPGEVVNYLKSVDNKFKGNRSEVTVFDKANNDISILLTVSEARIGEEYTFTAFIQNISVELF